MALQHLLLAQAFLVSHGTWAARVLTMRLLETKQRLYPSNLLQGLQAAGVHKRIRKPCSARSWKTA